MEIFFKILKMNINYKYFLLIKEDIKSLYHIQYYRFDQNIYSCKYTVQIALSKSVLNFSGLDQFEMNIFKKELENSYLLNYNQIF